MPDSNQAMREISTYPRSESGHCPEANTATYRFLAFTFFEAAFFAGCFAAALAGRFAALAGVFAGFALTSGFALAAGFALASGLTAATGIAGTVGATTAFPLPFAPFF